MIWLIAYFLFAELIEVPLPEAFVGRSPRLWRPINGAGNRTGQGDHAEFGSFGVCVCVGNRSSAWTGTGKWIWTFTESYREAFAHSPL